MDNGEVGARVAARRERLGLNQRELADAVDQLYPISQSTICRIEAGDRRLKMAEAVAVAAALGCPVDELLAPNPLSTRALVALRTSGSDTPDASEAVEDVLVLLRMTNDFCFSSQYVSTQA